MGHYAEELSSWKAGSTDSSSGSGVVSLKESDPKGSGVGETAKVSELGRGMSRPLGQLPVPIPPSNPPHRFVMWLNEEGGATYTVLHSF